MCGAIPGVAAAQADVTLFFPAYRGLVVGLHERGFESFGFDHRRLSGEALAGAALGWDLDWHGRARVRYLLAQDTPFGAPKVSITEPASARTCWRHVERDGTICLLPPGASWQPFLHPRAIAAGLRSLLGVLSVNLNAREPRPDTVGERHRWVSDPVRVWSLIPVSGFKGAACAARVQGRWVVAAHRRDLETWVEHRGLPPVPVKQAWVSWVDSFSEVPRDLADLSPRALRALDRGGLAVYGVPTEAGPLLVAVVRSEEGTLARLRVDRADRAWLHERGGTGLSGGLASAHVVLLGCGSLGAGVAGLLARAGVGKLTLVDPDTLSWDNVARHALGGESIGRPKALAVAASLRSHLPTTPEVVGLAERWQEVAARSPDRLEADVIVSTMAAWPDELALAEWLRPRKTPLVLGWLEPEAAAAHAMLSNPGCLACSFWPSGAFRHPVALPTKFSARLADGCHEHYLPYGYVDVVAAQALVTRLVIDVIERKVTRSTHVAWVPTPRELAALGAEASRDTRDSHVGALPSVSKSEVRRDLPKDPTCWLCAGGG